MIGALHIGEGPSLFSAEQANEVTQGPGYATPRAQDTILDRRDTTTRDRVREMLSAGASVEDIARAGGKYVATAPTYERAVMPSAPAAKSMGPVWYALGAAVVAAGAFVALRGRK